MLSFTGVVICLHCYLRVWFSLVPNCHDITEILLKVALNTIKQTKNHLSIVFHDIDFQNHSKAIFLFVFVLQIIFL